MIPLFNVGSFIICFEALPEEISMRHHFIKECGWTEKEYRALARKKPVWFCAKVSAWRDGEELGTAYLGCCCYDSEQEFYQSTDYFPDMVQEAIEEAEQVIAKRGQEV